MILLRRMSPVVAHCCRFRMSAIPPLLEHERTWPDEPPLCMVCGAQGAPLRNGELAPHQFAVRSLCFVEKASKFISVIYFMARPCKGRRHENSADRRSRAHS